MTSPEQLLLLADQSYNEQVIQYIEQQPKYEHSTLIVPVDEHIAKIQEDIPIFEVVQTTNLSIPATCNVKEVSDDSNMSLYTPQINEQPVIFNSSHVNQLERLYEKYVGKKQVLFNEELNQLEEIEVNFFFENKNQRLDVLFLFGKNIEEQLPEIEKTTVQMEVTYVTSYIQLPVNHPLNDLDPVSRKKTESYIDIQENRRKKGSVSWIFHMHSAAYFLAFHIIYLLKNISALFYHLQICPHIYPSSLLRYSRN